MIVISEKIPLDNFVISNNIIKGVDHQLPDTHYFGEAILDHLNTKLNHVAQIDADTGRQTTYAEMRDRSVRCAIWMKKQGIGRGDIVVACTHNQLDTYIPIFAAFYAGATFNAWYHETALKPARYLMSLFKPKVIFACESVVDILLEAAKLEGVDAKIVVFGKHSHSQHLNEILDRQNAKEVESFKATKINDPDDVAFIILSSGSTGLPKGVMHSYKNLAKMISCFLMYPMMHVALWYSTCYWITGFAFMFESLFSHGTRIIHEQFEADTTCQIIEKYKVQRFFCTPLVMTYMCKENVFKKYKLPSLEVVLTGGSKVNPQIFEEFKLSVPHCTVLQTFGMSETGRAVISQTEKTKNIFATGFVAPLIQLKVIDLETGKALGPNKQGEINIKSALMMIGYYQNPEATKAALDEDGWLRTGDIGYYDDNGEIFIIDRIKEIMKYQNHQISPNEIEDVLITHPDVTEVAVVPQPHEIDGDRPMAFVKKVPGSKVTEKELIKMSEEVLGSLKKLHGGVVFLDNLPKTPSGKISKPSLKEMIRTLVESRNA